MGGSHGVGCEQLLSLAGHSPERRIPEEAGKWSLAAEEAGKWSLAV